MSGERTGPGSTVQRGALSALEPIYAGVLWLRNRLYDVGLLRSHRLPRPVVSVGNITTGGTGKTPVVEFLARSLRDAGLRVCILSRGYKSAGGVSDEQRMLEDALNGPGLAPVRIVVNPNRTAGGRSAIAADPSIDLFLLDDGFQHRAVHRDLDIVLIDALEPFGYGHVLPRGMLREPLSGLARAGTVIITHADQVDAEALTRIESVLHRYRPAIPIYRCAHVHRAMRSADSPVEIPLADLGRRRFFLFCGIGNPGAMHAQLRKWGKTYVGHRFFPDHHHYSAPDLIELRIQAAQVGAEVLVTTEKDWAKLATLAERGPELIPVMRVALTIQFSGGGEEALIGRVKSVLGQRP